MGYLIRRDPRSGEIIEWVDLAQYPPPAQRPDYGPPAYPADYYPPAYPARVRQETSQGYWGPKRRRRKGVTWFIGLSWFIISFCLAGVHPGITICSWGVLLGWLVFRSFRD